MGKADKLSKRLDWKVGVEKDNEDQVIIKDNWICNLQEVVIKGPEVELLEKIKKAKSKDEDIVRIVEEMKKAKVKELHRNKWKIEGKLVLKEGKVYIPKDEELGAEVIQLHHNVQAARHSGRWKTIELVMRNYWWPGVIRDVGKYMEGCDLYQKMKNRIEKLAGKLLDAVHTGVEVHRMDLEMSRLVKRPWLQLICCTVCLPRGCNFR